MALEFLACSIKLTSFKKSELNTLLLTSQSCFHRKDTFLKIFLGCFWFFGSAFRLFIANVVFLHNILIYFQSLFSLSGSLYFCLAHHTISKYSSYNFLYFFYIFTSPFLLQGLKITVFSNNLIFPKSFRIINRSSLRKHRIL